LSKILTDKGDVNGEILWREVLCELYYLEI